MKKRFVLLTVLIALVLCLQPVTANAIDPEFPVNQGITHTWEESEDLYYTFTAPESATYVFYAVQPDDGAVTFEIRDAQDNYLRRGDVVQVVMTAGETYSVKVFCSSYNYNKTQKTTLYCKKGVDPTSVTVAKDSYVGFVGETIDMPIDIQPMNALSIGKWTSSDRSVVKPSGLFYYGREQDLDCLAVGTATISYSDSNNLTESFTVTVKQPTVMTMGKQVVVSVPNGGRVGYKFTAPADGMYKFIPAMDGDPYKFDSRNQFKVKGEGYDEVTTGLISTSNSGSTIEYGCYAGKDYIITFTNDSGKTVNMTFDIKQMLPATQLSIAPANSEVNVGGGAWLAAVYGPEDAIPESITWTSSNPAVVSIEFGSKYGCNILGVSEGTAVITAVSESGLTASATVTVGEKNLGMEGPPLVLNAPNKVVINDPENDWATFEFVPTVSGYYEFRHDADDYAVVGLTWNNQEIVFGYQFENKIVIAQWLEAGETYHVYSYYPSEVKTGTYNVYVSRINSVKNGWASHQGRWYYFEHGELYNGWKQIDGKWYYMRFNMRTGWVEIDDKMYFFDDKGVMQTGWQQVKDKWVYLGKGGAMQTGWVSVGGKWYYMGDDGVMQTGWVKDGGNWYYMNKSGVMQTGWQTINGYKYYFTSGGKMATGATKIDGKIYCFNSGGTLAKGWVQVGNKWYYANSAGVAQTGWVSAGGKWYYMDANGIMQTGLKQIGGKYYYFTSGGVMTTGWQTVNGTRHRFDSKGAAVSGWHSEGGKWYFLKNTGAVTTGWMQDGGYWYFMDKSTGAMKTGWVTDGGYWYYMNKSGVMQTGWIQDGSYWYYMNKSGVMVTGTQVINGKTYKFNSSGVWIG